MRGEADVVIKAIVELQTEPGRRAELKSLLENMVAQQGPGQLGGVTQLVRVTVRA